MIDVVGSGSLVKPFSHNKRSAMTRSASFNIHTGTLKNITLKHSMYGDVVGTAEIHFPPGPKKGLFKRREHRKPITFFFSSNLAGAVAEAGEDARVSVLCRETKYFTSALKFTAHSQGLTLFFRYENLKRTFA
jgi:hypothetical protein